MKMLSKGNQIWCNIRW